MVTSTACGDRRIVAVLLSSNTRMIEVKEPYTEIVFDTIAGLVKDEGEGWGRCCKKHHYAGCSKFLLENNEFDIPNLGKIEADIAYGGLWYAFIDAESIRLKPTRGK